VINSYFSCVKKSCSRCKKTLPVENFGVRGKKADGSTWYKSKCKPCEKEYNKERRNKPLDPNATYPETRKCYTCKEVKKLQEDFPYSDVINGKKTWNRDCNVCFNKSRQKYFQEVYWADPENVKRRKEYLEKYNEENDERIKAVAKKYHEKNKDRINARHRITDKEWYKKNAEYKKAINAKRREDPEYLKKEREKSKEYREANKGILNEKGKIYKKKNTDKINKRDKMRYANDPMYNLKARLRARTLTAFKRKGWKKNTRTQETLKGTWQEVEKHIEGRFVDGMSWDNMEKWDIDHIIPLASAKNEYELIALFHYKNTQPLWSDINEEKQAKYNPKDKEAYLNWYHSEFPDKKP